MNADKKDELIELLRREIVARVEFDFGEIPEEKAWLESLAEKIEKIYETKPTH